MGVKIAIDGPAVSGKSSAAKHLAHRLRYLYLDSGAVYRTITLASIRGFKTHSERLMSRLDDLKIKLTSTESGIGCDVFMKDEDVSEIIRTQDVTDRILPISGNPEIREWVTEYLREQAKQEDVVMDGRDIGSVVFPDADFKFFVTASLEARTRRRLKDLGDMNEGQEFETIHAQLEKRDKGDRERKIGPLLQTEDAVVIDNSNLNLDQTVDEMLSFLTSLTVAQESI